MSRKPIVIAVDGPSGSGKSSLSREVARRLGLTHVNTGTYYRLVGWRLSLLGSGAQLSDQCDSLLAEIRQRFSWDSHTGNPLWDREVCVKQLYSESAGALASTVAVYAPLRRHLTEIFRETAAALLPGAILDGRDIGMVVLPDADVKLFIHVPLATRARRRFRDEFPYADPDAPESAAQLAAMEELLRSRDSRDMARDHAPLVRAEGAIEISNTLPFYEVVCQVVEVICQRVGRGGVQLPVVDEAGRPAL